MSQAGTTNALVTEAGDVVGILTEDDYAHAMTTGRGFRSGIGQ